MPNVWIANQAGHDYEPAEKYGELKHLSLGDVNPLRVDRLLFHLARGITKFTAPEDFLLISGHHIVNMLSFSIWLRMHGQCRLLLWDAKERKYNIADIRSAHIDAQIDRNLFR